MYFTLILGDVVAGSSPKGDMVFLTVFLLQSPRLDIETHSINLFTFSPILLSCFLVRGRSIGLGQGLNWLRPGWTYPSPPPPPHVPAPQTKRDLPAVDKGVGEQVRRASSISGGVRVQVQTSSSPDVGLDPVPSGGVC